MEGAPDGRRGGRLRLLALAICLVTSLGLYASFAVVLGSVPAGWDGYVGFSLASAPMFRAFTHLPTVALTRAGFQHELGALLVGIWTLWGGAVLALRGLPAGDTRRVAKALVVVGSAAMLLLVVVLVPPVLSGDLYRQAIYGHMVALHGLNPYATPVSALAGDPLFRFANEPGATSFYGPAYTWASTLAAALAPKTPLGAALGWKAMSAAAAFGTVLLAAPVARALAPEASDGLEAQLWIAWNPVLIVESAATAHIEPIMTLPALAGLLLLLRTRPLRGFLLLVVSTLTKWLTGLLAVYALLRELRRAEPGRRLSTAVRWAAGGTLVVALFYAPFASGLFARGGLWQLAAHGTGYLGDKTAHAIPQWLFSAVFVALAAAAAPYASGGDWPRLITVVTALLMVFILLVPPWLFAWYLVTPIVLAAVLPPGRVGATLRIASVVLGADVMLYYAKLVPLR